MRSYTKRNAQSPCCPLGPLEAERKRDGFSAPAEVFAVSRTRLPYGWTGRLTTKTTVRKVMSSTWVATGWSEALRSMCSTSFIIGPPEADGQCTEGGFGVQ